MAVDMRTMTCGGRRWLAVIGGVVAGIALGGGVDVLLAHLDGYLMQATHFGYTTPPGFPGLASFAIVIAGAFFGLGIGLVGAALIGEPSAHELPAAASVGDLSVTSEASG